MIDVAAFTDRVEYGVGLVARDSSSQLVEAKTRIYHGQVVLEFAEAMAVKEAAGPNKRIGRL